MSSSSGLKVILGGGIFGEVALHKDEKVSVWNNYCVCIAIGIEFRDELDNYRSFISRGLVANPIYREERSI